MDGNLWATGALGGFYTSVTGLIDDGLDTSLDNLINYSLENHAVDYIFNTTPKKMLVSYGGPNYATVSTDEPKTMTGMLFHVSGGENAEDARNGTVFFDRVIDAQGTRTRMFLAESEIFLQKPYVTGLINEMNEIMLSSGDSDPNSDYFQLSIVMEAGATSSIYVYESGGSGFLAYNTRSDFITEFYRAKAISQETGQLSSSESLKIGYPNSFTWIPGDYIAYNAESYSTSTGYSLYPSTPKESLSDSEFLNHRR